MGFFLFSHTHMRVAISRTVHTPEICLCSSQLPACFHREAGKVLLTLPVLKHLTQITCPCPSPRHSSTSLLICKNSLYSRDVSLHRKAVASISRPPPAVCSQLYFWRVPSPTPILCHSVPPQIPLALSQKPQPPLLSILTASPRSFLSSQPGAVPLICCPLHNEKTQTGKWSSKSFQKS